MTKKNVIELLSCIIIAFALMIAVATTFEYLNKYYTESSNKILDLKAYCDSIDGRVGGDKCYKNGKEMFLGGEEK